MVTPVVRGSWKDPMREGVVMKKKKKAFVKGPTLRLVPGKLARAEGEGGGESKSGARGSPHKRRAGRADDCRGTNP